MKYVGRTLVLGSLLLHAAGADAQTLNPAERATIDAGRQVVKTEAVTGSSWPRVTIYQFIPGSPEEAVAVFADFERHRTFLPNVKQSRISRVVDSATVEVDYVLNMPIVADESYTVRNHVSGTPDGSGSGPRSFRVNWTLVRALTTKAAEGEARFEPYRDGTLLMYQNLVVPGSALAGIGFIRGRAQSEVEATVRAIAARVVKERASERPLLEQQVRQLRALTGIHRSDFAQGARIR